MLKILILIFQSLFRKKNNLGDIGPFFILKFGGNSYLCVTDSYNNF